MMQPIHIGNRLVGPGQPCFMVAEIGINHNGDVDLGCRMIEAAAASGADSVKFQNYCTEDFLSDRSLTYTYTSQGRVFTEPQYDLFKRCELNHDMLAIYKGHCDKCGVVFHSTPTNEEGVRDAVALGAPVLKNGSDYLGHLPLIRYMAGTGLPTVLSTGMAVVEEIDDAVRAFREAGGRDLILLHCTSSYPTPPSQVHLRKMNSLGSKFTCPVGFSDHTEGSSAAVAAVALGACWIEKHFTTDHQLSGPDQTFSADPTEFASLVRTVRSVECNLGDSTIGPAQAEECGRYTFRLSCVASRSLPKGCVIQAEDIDFKRPGGGFAPKNREWLIGQTMQKAVKKGEAFMPGHVCQKEGETR